MSWTTAEKRKMAALMRAKGGRLEREFAALGLTVHPSSANFVLVEFPDRPDACAEKAYQFLLGRGIIPRRLDNYGLPKCLRFSLGLADENQEVVSAVKAFLGAKD